MINILARNFPFLKVSAISKMLPNSSVSRLANTLLSPSIYRSFAAEKSDSDDDLPVVAVGRNKSLWKSVSNSQTMLRTYLDVIKYIPLEDHLFFFKTPVLELKKNEFDVLFFPELLEPSTIF